MVNDMEDVPNANFLCDLQSVLAERFGDNVHVEFRNGASRVSGRIVWGGFEGLDQVDRYTLVSRYLNERLGTQTRYISVIFTNTPEEDALLSAPLQLPPLLGEEDRKNIALDLKNKLMQKFGKRVHIDFPSGAHRACGYIISKDFENLEAIKQQTLVRDYLREQLGTSTEYVSVILTYTPHEYKVMSEGRYKPRQKRAKAA